MNKSDLNKRYITEYADIISTIIASHTPDTVLTNALQDAALSIVDEVRNSIYDGLRDYVKEGRYSDDSVSFQQFANITSAAHLETILQLCPDCDSARVLSDLQEMIKVSAAFAVARLRVRMLPEKMVPHE